MRIGPVTKSEKENKTTLKKFDNDVMLANCDVIVVLPVCGKFGAIRRTDSGLIVYNSYIFIKSNLLSYKK